MHVVWPKVGKHLPIGRAGMCKQHDDDVLIHGWVSTRCSQSQLPAIWGSSWSELTNFQTVSILWTSDISDGGRIWMLYVQLHSMDAWTVSKGWIGNLISLIYIYNVLVTPQNNTEVCIHTQPSSRTYWTKGMISATQFVRVFNGHTGIQPQL